MSPFNLDQYEPVEERLARFWENHPAGRIDTTIVNADEQSVVMLARVFRDAADERAAATGHAQETVGSNPVNKTSWVENCETSAIGRALANLGYAPKGGRASREEMAKAARPAPARPKPELKATAAQQKRIVIAASEAGIDDELRHRITRLLAGVTSSKDVPRSQVDRVVEGLHNFGEKPEANHAYLEAWEAENLPTTAAQAIREGSARTPGRAETAPRSRPLADPGLPPEGATESGVHILTAEDLEKAGQTRFDEPEIPS